jgi:hypothetical protein
MYIFAKFVTDHIFLQNYDKIRKTRVNITYKRVYQLQFGTMFASNKQLSLKKSVEKFRAFESMQAFELSDELLHLRSSF